MERILALKTEPVVGKRYLVPCVYHNGEWIPVMGDLHEDKDFIGFPYMHCHYDFRFLNKTAFEEFKRAKRDFPPGKKAGRIWNRVIVFGDEQSGLPLMNSTATTAVPVKIIEGPMLCLRKMPKFDPTLGKMNGLPELPSRSMQKAYQDFQVVLKDGCRLCPHRGLPLDGLPTEPGGVVTCRGHGLRWDKDGKLVPR